MDQKNRFLLVAIVLTTMACNALLRPVVNTEPTDTELVQSDANSDSQDVPTSPSEFTIQPTDVPLPLPLPELTIPPESSGECEGHRWAFNPVALSRYPQTNGVDSVFIDIAIHNGSDKYWGKADIPTYSSYLKSEDGQSQEVIQRFTDSTLLQIVPPGFTLLGILNPLTEKVERFTFEFKVPSVQRILTLHIPGVQIECVITQTEFGYEELFELSYPLDNFANYTLPISDDYSDLGSQLIDIPILGTFEYKGQTEEENRAVLHFSFTNTSGYTATGFIFPYLVGDDGVLRIPDQPNAALQGYDGAYYAESAQTVDVNPVAFKIPSGVGNLKFFLQVLRTNATEFSSPFLATHYEVYNFMP